jgi:Spy/CpxP family protein refolding chaperone
MESINRQKWRVRLSVVAIFLLGCVAGGLAVNLYNRGRIQARGPVPPYAHRGGGFEGLLKSLNLNEQQQKQVDEILTDTRQQLMEIRHASEPQYIQVRTQTQERLKAVLTDDQWNQFQQLMKERRDRFDRPDRPDRPDRQHRRPLPEVDQSPHQ